MTPTERELRELDLWIAINLFDLKPLQLSDPTRLTQVSEGDPIGFGTYSNASGTTSINWPLPHYTKDRAAAFMVLEKCCEKHVWVEIEKTLKCDWFIQGDGIGLVADTLPLAICLLAKELFSQVEK